MLIAALLELKSRLLLPGEEEELIELDPGEAAEELLARLLDAHRYRARRPTARAAAPRRATGSARRRCRPHSGGPRCEDARAVYDPGSSAAPIGELLRDPRAGRRRATWSAPKVSVAERLAHLRALLRRGSFNFAEAVAMPTG